MHNSAHPISVNVVVTRLTSGPSPLAATRVVFPSPTLGRRKLVLVPGHRSLSVWGPAEGEVKRLGDVLADQTPARGEEMGLIEVKSPYQVHQSTTF